MNVIDTQDATLYSCTADSFIGTKGYLILNLFPQSGIVIILYVVDRKICSVHPSSIYKKKCENYLHDVFSFASVSNKNWTSSCTCPCSMQIFRSVQISLTWHATPVILCMRIACLTLLLNFPVGTDSMSYKCAEAYWSNMLLHQFSCKSFLLFVIPQQMICC